MRSWTPGAPTLSAWQRLRTVQLSFLVTAPETVAAADARASMTICWENGCSLRARNQPKKQLMAGSRLAFIDYF